MDTNTLTTTEREEMEHAVGLDYARARSQRAYKYHARNVFVCGTESPLWESLVARELAVKLGRRFDNVVYAVTRRGCALLGMTPSMVGFACGSAAEIAAHRARLERGALAARLRYADHKRRVAEQRALEPPPPLPAVQWHAWELGTPEYKREFTAPTAKQAAIAFHEHRNREDFEYGQRAVVVQRANGHSRPSHWLCRSATMVSNTLCTSRRAAERRERR